MLSLDVVENDILFHKFLMMSEDSQAIITRLLIVTY
jgi:hypothetical protein